MIASLKLNQLPVYIGAGVLSGAISWAGGFVLPENGWLVKIYPGLVLGLALYLVHSNGKISLNTKTLLPLLTLMAASVIGWRLAVDVGYQYGSPMRFTAAGALGALAVAMGLLWVWRIRATNAMGLFLILVTAAGAFGGWFFRILHGSSPGRLGDDLWTFLLFVEWQVILFASIWLARQIVKIGK
jgi:hypothetical protein